MIQQLHSNNNQYLSESKIKSFPLSQSSFDEVDDCSFDDLDISDEQVGIYRSISSSSDTSLHTFSFPSLESNPLVKDRSEKA
jgi:hypothetical protein